MDNQSKGYVELPDDHPLMLAWNRYKAGEEYASNRKWVTTHADGSLWGAFYNGWMAFGLELEESRRHLVDKDAVIAKLQANIAGLREELERVRQEPGTNEQLRRAVEGVAAQIMEPVKSTNAPNSARLTTHREAVGEELPS